MSNQNSPATRGFWSGEADVKPEWIDYNGHLNMAYYLVILDHAADEFWLKVGLGDAYQAQTGRTTYTGSCKIDYIAEVSADAIYKVRLVLLELSDKKFITWQGIYTTDGTLRASAETLTLHVDQNGDRPRVTAFPDEIYAKLVAAKAEHEGAEIHGLIGRPIEMKRPPAES
jgi:acyl-CoA thioester hydrolase